MKLSTMLGRILGLLGFFFIEVAHAQNGAGVPSDADSDPVVSEINKAEMQPCSCDCCMVAKRYKSEEVSFSDGTKLESKCVPPAKDQENPYCTQTCKASEADSVITAAVQTMDDTRYCNYKCKPVTNAPGDKCIRLTAKENEMVEDDTGNGDDGNKIYAADVALERDAGTTAATVGGGAAAPAAAAADSSEGADNSAHVRWDIRKVIAQRLRAEAGADMARAAATEQRIHSDVYVINKDKDMAEYVQKVLTPVEGKGQEAQVATEAEAKTAGEERAIALTHFREAQVDAKTVVEETKKLVKIEIKKQAMAAAKQEAEADAYMQAWDKPDNWGKTLAVRAAAPYLQEMVNAITRVSEYDGFSHGLLSQAQGAQSQAQKLVQHANLLKAQGDLLGSATEEKKIKLLINKAKTLEEEANKFWKVADDTRKTIPEWQMGGNMAAARAAWEFKNFFTPPPDSFLQIFPTSTP